MRKLLPVVVLIGFSMSGCETVGVLVRDGHGRFTGSSERGSVETDKPQVQRIAIADPERVREDPDKDFRFDEVFSDQPMVSFEDVDFAAVDLRVRTLPADADRSFDSLVTHLLSVSTNQWELARAIYVWVADNISYDTNAYFSGGRAPFHPESVLRRRMAVCEGYSRLFHSLAHSSGLIVDQVSGYAKGYGHRPGEPVNDTNHAWNRVRIYGEWVLIDTTWGSGYLDGRSFVSSFNDFYFAPDPKALIFSHFPTDPEFQYLATPIDARTFTEMPRVANRLFSMGLDPAYVLETVTSGGTFTPPDFFIVPVLTDFSVKAVDIPWSSRLCANETYDFVLDVDPQLPLTLINNDRRIDLEYSDTIASITVQPTRGEVGLVVRENEQTRRYYYFMKWVVD